MNYLDICNHKFHTFETIFALIVYSCYKFFFLVSMINEIVETVLYEHRKTTAKRSFLIRYNTLLHLMLSFDDSEIF